MDVSYFKLIWMKVSVHLHSRECTLVISYSEMGSSKVIEI